MRQALETLEEDFSPVALLCCLYVKLFGIEIEDFFRGLFQKKEELMMAEEGSWKNAIESEAKKMREYFL